MQFPTHAESLQGLPEVNYDFDLSLAVVVTNFGPE